MRGRLTAGNVAALVLGTLLLLGGLTRTASAFEWDLPGERKFSIHGFYESRLLFVGSDLPANGATWSSFRHVLSTEAELTIFPDGFGPFDSMFMFTRFLVSYECIYTHACWTASSADSYGGKAYPTVRQPLSLKEDVKNNSPYFAGLLKQQYRPGTVTPAREKLNPGRRYRDCDNPPGVFSNPWPLAVFCNLNSRSPLDGPIQGGTNKFNEVRAGAFTPLSRPSLLAASRPAIGEAEFLRIQSLMLGGQVLSRGQDAQRRGLLVEAAEADARGERDVAQALRSEADEILGTPQDNFDANIPNLLATRPDPNRFEIFANSLAPGLLEAQWGSSQLRNLIWPFLATIDTPIVPQGYFANGSSLDFVGQYEQGLSESLNGAAQVGGLPGSTDSDGVQVLNQTSILNEVNPFFIGPDGIRNTADDLPFVTGNEDAQGAGYLLAPPIAGTDVDRFDAVSDIGGVALPVYNQTAQITVPKVDAPGTTTLVELYGVYNPAYLTRQACFSIGGVFNPATGVCAASDGTDLTSEAQSRGCKVEAGRRRTAGANNVGVNADGDCIEINTTSTGDAQVQIEVLPLLGDLRSRPGDSIKEPLDNTDLKLFADRQSQLPARPRNNKNGIYFQSPGQRAEYNDYHELISNLDLKYSVDSLAWNHGASQTEHEFMEGYLEFEMADSQVYARLGKLIVVWGKTELFRNQDRNNPLDIGNGIFAPLEEQRVGQWALDLTFSPEAFMRVGPVEDLRLEFLTIFNPFEPTDLGKCGEGTAVDFICLKSFGAMASGLAGIGVIGEHRPYNDYSGIERWDFGARLEGRLDRFTFAISDFYGWDDGFYLDVVQQYERVNDPTSGAPLSVSMIDRTKGCKVRTNSEGLPVGPNGIAGDGDDILPTEGQCLLWDKPNADGVQTMRSPNAIAKLQNINQTIFHSLCSYTFDPDEGYCAFDRVNDPDTFGFISQILSGLGSLGGIVLDGTDTIRTRSDGVDQRTSVGFLSAQFMAANPLAEQNSRNQDLGAALQPEQAALLGCGAAYASPCSEGQAAEWRNIPALANSLKRTPDGESPRFGGIDLMNADGSVITQEFVGVKALSPGALVGTKLNQGLKLYYQSGMNFSRDGVIVTVPVPGTLPRQTEPGRYLDLTPNQVLKMGREGRARFQTENLSDPNVLKVQADGWVEPMPWTVNQEYLKKFGAIVFNTDPNNPVDLASPLNQFNLIDKNGPVEFSNIDGEYCARWFDSVNVATPFNGGCTALETASANFERLLIATEIIGPDRVFDPPESLRELSIWAQSNTAKQEAGDPIAGGDGVFARNQFVLNDDEMDFGVVRAFESQQLGSIQLDLAPGEKTAATAFLDSYNPNTQCLQATCFLQINPVLSDEGDVQSTDALVIDLPIGTTVNIVEFQEPNDPNDDPIPEPTGEITKVNLAKLQLRDMPTLRRLFAGLAVTVDGQAVQMSAAQRQTLLGGFDTRSPLGHDLDNDGVTDLDRDRDGVWDGQDDGSEGPITDDNILCGSGVPGDKLQDGIQYDPYRADEAVDSEAFKNVFPDGLPPRSPVFCRAISGLLSATTQTLPVKKAGGDGRYGRRDFLWQGGQQVAFNYQKKNVMGFGLDFAEDVTKTSWGLEFSWMANKIFQNSLEYDGLSKSDEMVLSISVDRPTFFNFLNPNRSFFLNLQTFIRYLPNYDGGSKHNDGMYGAARGPVTGNIVFTFFTGYFQDRLAPRVSLLYAPFESQGAAITALSYRWNDAFSTTIGYTQFFGHVYRQQGAYFPISQYGSIQDYNNNPVTRGVAPVLYRDQAELRIRYTW